MIAFRDALASAIHLPGRSESGEVWIQANNILAMPEMQAIRNLLAYVIASYERSGVDIATVASLPDSVREWVLS